MQKGHTIQVLDHGYVRYVDHMGTDQRIVESARVSYASPSKGEAEDKKLLNYLWKNRHTSPFEMCKITFDIKMPIFVARQYIRHRMQNVNEFSMRYSEAPDEFYIPAKWRAQAEKNKQASVIEEKWDGRADDPNPSLNEMFSIDLERHAKRSMDLYKKYRDAGVAREMARMCLPLNIYTMFYATWDMKNLLHFISLRDDSHAQAEIQDYGKAIKAICADLFPWTMEAYAKYKWVCYEEGSQVG